MCNSQKYAISSTSLKVEKFTHKYTLDNKNVVILLIFHAIQL